MTKLFYNIELAMASNLKNSYFELKGLKFFIDFCKKNPKKFWLIVFSAFLYSFASTSFLTKAATIPSGLSSINLTLSFILPIVKPYLNIIYLGLNTPLFLLFWKKLSKKYVYLTLFFLILNAIFGFLIGFDFGTVINGQHMSFDFWVNQNVFVFCPPVTENELAFSKENHLNNLISTKVSDYLSWLEKSPIRDKSDYQELNKYYSNTGITIGLKNGWPIFIYMISACITSVVSAAIAWKCGGSTGGTDIVAHYYSTKKKKPVGSFLTIIGLIVAFFSLLTIWLLSTQASAIITKEINGFKHLVGLQTLSSLVYIILYGKVLNIIYPKYSKVVIRIDTLNYDLMKELLSSKNFNHPFKIYTLTSGMTGNNIYTFETVVLLLESELLIERIKKTDPSSWITKTDINKIYGNFDYSAVE